MKYIQTLISDKRKVLKCEMLYCDAMFVNLLTMANIYVQSYFNKIHRMKCNSAQVPTQPHPNGYQFKWKLKFPIQKSEV